MEEWQRKHIQQNITQLIKLTLSDPIFIAKAWSRKLLSEEEMRYLISIRNLEERSKAFYKLVQKEANSYETLKQILQETNQSGAFAILNQAFENTSGLKIVGKISYDPSKLLGEGSYNTKVYKGRFENKDVAVKILSLADLGLGTAFEEINTLTNLDWHANVIHYFKVEFTNTNILIAIELCKMDLGDFVESSHPKYAEAVDVIKQMTEGLAFLHSKQIVHRDLKPWNILISYPDARKLNVKLSDFGISRKLTEGSSKITLTGMAGTPGWMAPEDLRQWENMKGKFYASKAADIFALGCIFYFVLTGGGHPFGSPLMRQANILQNKSEMDPNKIKSEKFRANAFIWLINQMISDNPVERPKANGILTHPVFWETEKILAFFQDIYPFIGFYKDDIFDNASQIITKEEDWNWLDALDCPVKEYLRSNRTVDGTKCAHLLKVIVEMHTSYSSLPQNIQQLLDNLPDKYLTFWGDRFPFFLPLLWTIYKHLTGAAFTIQNYYVKDSQQERFIHHILTNSLNDASKPLLNVTQSHSESEERDEQSFHTNLVETSIAKLSVEDKDRSQDTNNPSLPNKPKCYINRVLKGVNCKLAEEEFFSTVCSNVDFKPVIINGPTGMGKTTFFAQIGRRILRTFSQRKVIYLKLQLIIDEVRRVNKTETIKKEIIWDALKTLTGESDLKKQSLSLKAPSGSLEATELFLDDLDLVQDNDWDLVCNIIKCISVSYPFTHIRLWIAALPKDLERIEALRNFESYSIEPLDEAGQVEILTSYLVNHTSKVKLKLVEFAKKCVTKYKLENPLQCLLVGAATAGDTNFIESKDFSKFEPQNVQSLSSIYGNLLINAAYKRSFHTLELILDLHKFNIDCIGELGYPPLFFSVIESSNVDCFLKLKLLIERGAKLYHLTKDSFNLLHCVARYGSLKSLTYILNLEKFDINIADIDGDTPLFKSIYAGNNSDCLLKMKLLIDKGVYLDNLDAKSNNLLLQAARYGSVETLSYILSMNKFDINCMNVYEYTPLFLSVIASANYDCLQKLKLLIDMGANLHYKMNIVKGGNLLCFAAFSCSAEVLQYILDTFKFDINSEDKNGNTPLLLSAFNNKSFDAFEKFKMLLERGANKNHVNKVGWNLLHCTASYGSFDVLEYVVNLAMFDINSVDKLGKTALYYAKTKDGNSNLTNADVESKVKLLIEKGCIDKD